MQTATIKKQGKKAGKQTHHDNYRAVIGQTTPQNTTPLVTIDFTLCIHSTIHLTCPYWYIPIAN
jgi:hypothetical protein